MKTYLSIIINLLLCAVLFSCNGPNHKSNLRAKPEPDDSIYIIVEQMPCLKACENETNPQNCTNKYLLNYFMKNLKLEPLSEEEPYPSKLRVSFVVEPNGEISQIECATCPASNILEVIKTMGEWVPGKQQGMTKRVRLQYPVNIHLE